MQAIPAEKPVVSIDVIWSTISFALAAEVFVQFLAAPDVVLVAFMVLNLQAGYLFWVRDEARPVQPIGYLASGAPFDTGAPNDRRGDAVAVLSMLLVVFYQINADHVPGLSWPEAVTLLGAIMCFVSCWALG